MKAHSEYFKYEIGDKVHIADYPEIQGRITGMCVRAWGDTYAVCWWQDGRRYDEWLHEREIAKGEK